MASKEVVFTTCDRCYTEVQTDIDLSKRAQPYQIPVGWLHIHANSRTASVFEMDLCPDCKGIVIEAAGRAA
jgi:hypothetical protein